MLQSFVRLLGGDVDHFTKLLDNAHHEASHGTAILQPAAHLEPEPTPTGADAVMKTFSKILTEDHTVEDGRARLLHKLAKQNPETAHTRRRPMTAITEALRQRKLPPATTITPSGPDGYRRGIRTTETLRQVHPGRVR
ncbi:hypothetical protein ABZ636_37785 [Streptomyces sp. NPDC007251]|uniref:hypothetical protein n=1 Tax=Streptomyces sp. NPDC007251 TaxID=3154483 RepID=UPI0033F45D0E